MTIPIIPNRTIPLCYPHRTRRDAPAFRGRSGCTGKVGRVKSTRSAWLLYTSLRLLFVAVPFAIVYWLGLQLGFSIKLSGFVAIIIGALIGVSLSVIFLSRPRSQAAQGIVDWRNRDRTEDDIEEDAALDGETAPAEEASSPEEAPSTEEAPSADASR